MKTFLPYKTSLKGTENRIATERMRFNEVTQTFNQMVRRFPTNVIASMLGFGSKPYFEAQEGAERVPEVRVLIAKVALRRMVRRLSTRYLPMIWIIVLLKLDPDDGAGWRVYTLEEIPNVQAQDYRQFVSDPEGEICSR